MSTRRRGANGNAIRGPQSALTDYLAANNISANQIRLNYLERQRQAEQDGTLQADDPGEGPSTRAQELAETQEEDSVETRKKKRKQAAALEKIKKSKEFAKRKRQFAGEPGEDDDDEIALDMYQKSKPAPGQFENCEICSKRFTVTPYTKEGPNGGLTCMKCGKDFGAADKKKVANKKNAVNRETRRKVQSELLDKRNPLGSKSLLELCVETVAKNITDVEAFGDLPPTLLDRLSHILSKRRVLDPRTLDFFIGPDLTTVAIYDCAKLETDDFVKIFSFSPQIKNIKLENAGQFKDQVIDYVTDNKALPLRSIMLEAANLVSDDRWKKLFSMVGKNLEELKLTWLDSSFDDEILAHVVTCCPNLKYLKLKKCWRLTGASLAEISKLKKLEHLYLRMTTPVETQDLNELIWAVGPNLRTLSLQKFEEADDTTLQAIHDSCTNLQKLRFTDNENCTDAALENLFKHWKNPPLRSISFADVRDMSDAAGPDGNLTSSAMDLDNRPSLDYYGLASVGFKALMHHSGSTLEYLNLKSCRHIDNQTIMDVFDGKKTYPAMKSIDMSFVSTMDTVAAVGIFRSCLNLEELVLFGCFEVKDIIVPPGVRLIGVPHMQDAIVQEGEIRDDVVEKMLGQ